MKVATTHIKYDTAITRAYHRVVERRGRKLVATAKGFFSVAIPF